MASVYSMYVEEYERYVPTGNRNNASNDNYRVAVSSKWYALGYLWRYNANSEKLLFCPSQTNTFFVLEGQAPPYPAHDVDPPNGSLRAGYCNYMSPDWNGTTPSGVFNTSPSTPFKFAAGRKLYRVDDLYPPNARTSPVG